MQKDSRKLSNAESARILAKARENPQKALKRVQEMRAFRAAVPKIAPKTRNDIAFQILDSAFNTFIRRILWPETRTKRISNEDSRQMANVIVSVLEMTQEAIENGAISDHIRAILQQTA